MSPLMKVAPCRCLFMTITGDDYDRSASVEKTLSDGGTDTSGTSSDESAATRELLDRSITDCDMFSFFSFVIECAMKGA